VSISSWIRGALPENADASGVEDGGPDPLSLAGLTRIRAGDRLHGGFIFHERRAGDSNSSGLRRPAAFQTVPAPWRVHSPRRCPVSWAPGLAPSAARERGGDPAPQGRERRIYPVGVNGIAEPEAVAITFTVVGEHGNTFYPSGSNSPPSSTRALAVSLIDRLRRRVPGGQTPSAGHGTGGERTTRTPRPRKPRTR